MLNFLQFIDSAPQNGIWGHKIPLKLQEARSFSSSVFLGAGLSQKSTSRPAHVFAEDDEAEGAKDESTEREREMILTRVPRRVASDAALHGCPGVAEGFAGNHPVHRSLDGVLPLAQAVVALPLRQRRNVSVHRRHFLLVADRPNVQSFARDVSGTQSWEGCEWEKFVRNV